MKKPGSDSRAVPSYQQENVQEIAKLQGVFATVIHDDFPPLVVELCETGKLHGEWDGYHITGRFYYQWVNRTDSAAFDFTARMSMHDTALCNVRWPEPIRFGYNVADAIKGSVPSRVFIDYNLVLIPKLNAAQQAVARGRLVVEDRCITNNQIVHMRDTLWDQQIAFRRTTPKTPCIYGAEGMAYFRFMLAKVMQCNDPRRSDGLLQVGAAWCEENKEWIAANWFCSRG